MRSSKGQSVFAMRSELSKEKSSGTHLFEGIISRVDADRALTASVPYQSNRDFDLKQYGDAEKAALQELETDPARHIGRVDGADRKQCPRVGEFLTTILQLMSDATSGHATPESLSYMYNARHYTATMLSVEPVAERTVHVQYHANGGSLDRTYRNMKSARFEVACSETEPNPTLKSFWERRATCAASRCKSITSQIGGQIVLNLEPNLPVTASLAH